MVNSRVFHETSRIQIPPNLPVGSAMEAGEPAAAGWLQARANARHLHVSLMAADCRY